MGSRAKQDPQLVLTDRGYAPAASGAKPVPCGRPGATGYRGPMLAIGIDIGTTNVKAALVDADGVVAAEASRPLTTLTDGPAVTQDAGAIWSAVRDAVRDISQGYPAQARQVKAIGACSQYSSLVPVDTDGEVIAGVKLYLDTRGADHCWAILDRHPSAFGTWVEHHGIPPIGSGLTLSHLLHFQLDEPEVHARTATYLEVMDFVNLRLTGRAVATQCTMFASQLCDNRDVGATAYDDDLIAMSGVDRTRLPQLIGIDDPVGELLPHVATDLDLPSGITVMAGMNDTHAGAFATGALADPRRRGVVVGTTAVMIQSLDTKAVDLDHEVLSMPAPAPGSLIVMAENGVAGRSVERVLELLSPSGDDVDRFAELSEALERTTAGAGGLIFLPWLAGSMSPSSTPEMRGGFLGMTLTTSRDDVLRATVEGVARNLRWLSPAVDSLCGHPAEELVFAGGAARSGAVAQVLADVSGQVVRVVDRPEIAAARATGQVAARRKLGLDPTTVSLPVASEHHPDPVARAVHDRLQPLFEAAFTATAPICQSLGHE